MGASASTSLTERFLDRISPEPNSGCWLWIGGVTTAGYGIFSLGRNKLKMYAHRFSYERAKGPIPPGFQIDHKCRVTCCCNPDHLEAVTPGENTRRGIGLSAQRAKQTHCKNGHEFTAENTYQYPHGSRQCVICRRANDQKRGWRR